MNYEKFLTTITKKRKPNLIRHLTAASLKNPTALNFAGGMPNTAMFPFKEISVTYSDDMRKVLTGTDLFSALQYGPTAGYLPLQKKWREFQCKWHSLQYDNWDVCFTTGSMEGCSKILEMIIEKGEPLMLQSPTFVGIIGTVVPMQSDLIPIRMDDDGALPNDIVNACEERIKSNRPLPKLLYVNPTGANPVGTVYTNERKEKIYKLAQKYDFLILEDDPYYFLHFLDENPRSFLSMDTDGRVLRLDSFSKIISAGLRLGVVTGPQPLLEKLALHINCSTIHASALSQMLVYSLLSSWNDDDVQAHFTKIQKFYRDKRDIMLKAIEKHFTGIAEWSVPRGGMFVWLKITVLEDTYDLAMIKCMMQDLYILPGHCFYPKNDETCQYLRLAYSHIKSEVVEEAISKIAAIIRSTAANK
ncbi:PREDICTED: kynurenine/alpha-aminoadipate aminotransferase, mitochondrial-like [Ceratosolen solmsi marchali]|uniref:Kynurenine/alpha-aminoadipate aminotransferase, mitochondrial-like n=1 Tax=Ceratosolen solmsi marchali TaxID=326594 RepID=A0AAJ6YPV1_9HYME|nr:PREDICTED: kynurenine/alpha-aminoadipate aminotransferase, mitochondrial-like [Ceratosolen solmsi marchali]